MINSSAVAAQHLILQSKKWVITALPHKPQLINITGQHLEQQQQKSFAIEGLSRKLEIVFYTISY